MNGGDFRKFGNNIGTNERVLFQDKDGNYHEVYTAVRTRYDGCSVAILKEVGAVSGQWPMKLDKPPQELIDYLNSL